MEDSKPGMDKSGEDGEEGKEREEREKRTGGDRTELSPFYGSPEGLERSQAFQDTLPSSENPCSEKRGASRGALSGTGWCLSWVVEGLGNSGLKWQKRVHTV